MANNILISPPHWCRYAVPSVRGWCDPKTGELLIAVRGIKFDQVKVMEVGEKPEIPALLKPQIGVPSTKDPEVKVVADKIADVKEVVEVVEQPKEEAKPATKKRATTKKKTTTSKKTTAK